MDLGQKLFNVYLSRRHFLRIKNFWRTFWAHLAEILDIMGYNPRYAHPYVWIWPELNPNVFEYYEYILCYVDDVVFVSADTVIL